MKVLIDIGHPAHVHLFKNFAHGMIRKGHAVHFTVRSKEHEISLLESEKLAYTNFGKHYRSVSGKIWGLLKFTYLEIVVSFRFKPDIYLSHGSFYAAWASRFFGKPHISMEDTGNQEQVKLYLPFTKAVLTSTSFPFKYGSKQICYEGYHELAYLHPHYFSPDPRIKNDLFLKDDEKYYIVRFVAWNASHDFGQERITFSDKKHLINLLSQKGKVFISCEKEFEPEFEPYKFPLSPDKMHSALAYAELFIGEGATMASEAAVLGTPSVYINSLQRGYLLEQEKSYGLVYNFTSVRDFYIKASEILSNVFLKENCEKSRKKLLNEKIDLTAFLIWFIESWPESFNIMRKNPEYQNNFKYF
jgi:uncharacterized protein